MKAVYLSRHARRRMRLHKITLEQVEETLREPEKVAPSIKGRYNAFKKTGGRLLRVTYIDEVQRYVIVTVTPRDHF